MRPNRRRHRTGWAVLVGLWVVAGTAQAQSIYGPGGLLLNPTADFPARGQITPAVLVIPQESNELRGSWTWASYTLDYGVSERLEVGVTHLRINPSRGAFQDASTGGFAKYRLIAGKGGVRPDVAVGAGFLGGGDVDAQVGFVALRFSPEQPDPRHPAHIHLGLLYADELNGVTRDEVVPYGGVDLGIARNLILFAEVRALMESKPAAASDINPASAIGLVWRPARSTKVAIALANNGWSDGHKLSFGVGYTIGTRR